MQNAKCKSRAVCLKARCDRWGARGKATADSTSAKLGSTFCILHFAFCIALLAACAPSPPADTEGPVRAAEAFVAALEARDTSAIIRLLEPSDWRGEIGPELRSYLGLMEELELRDPQYSVLEQQGDTAVVQVTGSFAYKFAEGGASGERPVDLRVETVLVADTWYLRGLDLPQP